MKAYSFANTIVLINGVEITGWAEGDDVISVKRRTDSISDKVGAGGSMMVSISSDKSGEIEFKLQQTSESNNFLSETVAEMEAAGGAVPTFTPATFQFQDVMRRDLAIGSAGYITRPADLMRGHDANNQTWKLVVENLQMLLGE